MGAKTMIWDNPRDISQHVRQWRREQRVLHDRGALETAVMSRYGYIKGIEAVSDDRLREMMARWTNAADGSAPTSAEPQ